MCIEKNTLNILNVILSPLVLCGFHCMNIGLGFPCVGPISKYCYVIGTVREHLGSFRFCGGIRVALFFFCVVFFAVVVFLCLVPSVACLSGVSILSFL